MWDPEQQIRSMQPAVGRLVTQLNKDGVHFLSTTRGLTLEYEVTDNNVGFYHKDNLNKVVVISYHSFYRFTGISCIAREKKGENNQSETIPVTDDMYMQMFMRPVIHALLQA